MLFIFFIAILNFALGFALALYLGGHYCTIRKFGMKIPIPLKSVPPLVESTAATSAVESQLHPPVDRQD